VKHIYCNNILHVLNGCKQNIALSFLLFPILAIIVESATILA
jgi:hypothetical protein